MKRILISSIISAMLLMLFVIQAQAANNSTTVALPVSQEIISSDGSAATIHYRLTAEDINFPLPEGSKNGAFDFVITGNHSDTILLKTIVDSEQSYLLEAFSDNLDISHNKVKIVIESEKASAYLPDGTKFNLHFTATEKTEAESSTKPTDSHDEGITKPAVNNDNSTVKTGDSFIVFATVFLLLVISSITFIYFRGAKRHED